MNYSFKGYRPLYIIIIMESDDEYDSDNVYQNDDVYESRSDNSIIQMPRGDYIALKALIKFHEEKEKIYLKYMDKCKNKILVRGRVSIPKPIKNKCWDLYIGKDKGIGKCFVCNENEISSKHYECGHVLAVANGGDNNVTNLRPICSECNKSMGTMNLDDYKAYIEKMML